MKCTLNAAVEFKSHPRLKVKFRKFRKKISGIISHLAKKFEC